MRERFRHVEHVFRAAALFVGGFALFLVIRWLLVPPDFGVYGFYRAGALADARAIPAKYAGEAVCLDCHADVGDTRRTARHATIKCEACHGPLARHATGNFDIKPRALNPRLLCLQCHTKGSGKPPTLPQVVAADHAPEGSCIACHQPHRPKID
jgi:Cytochrome c7 and related cytochrome c